MSTAIQQRDLVKAKELLDAGNLPEAEAICKSVLAADPTNSDAYNILGIVAANSNRNDIAAQLFNEAIKLSPRNTGAICNLGSALKGLGKKDAAMTCYKQALELNAGYVPALIEIGILHKENENYDEAEKFLKKALKSQPQNVKALNNLCSVLHFLGRDDESITYSKKYLKKFPDDSRVAHNVGTLLKDDGKYEEAIPYFEQALSSKKDNIDSIEEITSCFYNMEEYDKMLGHIKKYEDLKDEYPHVTAINIYEAKKHFTDGNFDLCQKALEKSKNLLNDTHEINSTVCANILNYRAFHKILSKLIKYYDTHKDLYEGASEDTLYLIGESHSLVPCHNIIEIDNKKYKCASSLVIGAKAFHLGQDSNNRFKKVFKKKLKNIPNGSKLVPFFGEIDCRNNEGIYTYYQKNNDIDLAEHIDEMVNKYADFILGEAHKKGIEVIFYGVPATAIPLTDTDRKVFLSIIENFNDSLRKKSKKEGCKFIDIYKETVSNDKTAKKDMHIDNFHIYPHIFTDAIEKIETNE